MRMYNNMNEGQTVKPSTEVLASNGMLFALDSIVAAADMAPRPNSMQVKITKEYRVDGVSVTLVGKMDAVCGATIVDWKTTKRPINPDKYIDSYQWRCYLDMSGYHRFQFHVWKLMESRDEGMFLLEVPDQHFVSTQISYARMHLHILNQLSNYVEFLLGLESQGLVQLSETGTTPGPEYKNFIAEHTQ